MLLGCLGLLPWCDSGCLYDIPGIVFVSTGFRGFTMVDVVLCNNARDSRLLVVMILH